MLNLVNESAAHVLVACSKCKAQFLRLGAHTVGGRILEPLRICWESTEPTNYQKTKRDTLSDLELSIQTER